MTASSARSGSALWLQRDQVGKGGDGNRCHDCCGGASRWSWLQRCSKRQRRGQRRRSLQNRMRRQRWRHRMRRCSWQARRSAWQAPPPRVVVASGGSSSSAALRTVCGCSRVAAAGGFAVCAPNARSSAAELPVCGFVRAAHSCATCSSSCGSRWWRRRRPDAPLVASTARSGAKSTEATTAVNAAVAVRGCGEALQVVMHRQND